MSTPIIKKRTFNIISVCQTALLILVLFCVFTSFLSISIVPSLSMYPTLNRGTVLLGTRNIKELAYDDIVEIFPYDAMSEGSPLTSAIIMRAHKATLYCKRCVGLPGDTIAVHDGHLYRNGEIVVSDYTKDKLIEYEMEAVTLQNDEYFMMGDNRNNSYDSHYFGPIHKNQIFCKVLSYM